MPKKLREIIEVAEPKSPDEKRFKAKHKIEVTLDASGNGDDVFNASNVKVAPHKKQSENAYEEVQQVDESATSDSYDMHHERALTALETLGKHLKTHKKLTKSERGHWDIKDLSRSLEDHVHSAGMRNEWEQPMDIKR
jgi:hypothetical protein